MRRQLPYAGGVRASMILEPQLVRTQMCSCPTQAASGGTMPPEPPAGALPLDPNFILPQSKCLAHMPLGRFERQQMIELLA